VEKLHSRTLEFDEELYLEALGILILHYENIAYPRDWSDVRAKYTTESAS